MGHLARKGFSFFNFAQQFHVNGGHEGTTDPFYVVKAQYLWDVAKNINVKYR